MTTLLRPRSITALLLAALTLLAAVAVTAPASGAAGAEDERLTASFAVLGPDPYPATGRVGGAFSTTGAVALDYLRRSLVADLGTVSAVGRVELVDRDATSRLTASDYTLWSSRDNQSYQRLDDWTLRTRQQDGRLVHEFTGLSAEARYVKITTRYDDTAFTFVVDKPAEDVRLFGTAGEPDPGAALDVVDSWKVTSEATYPDVERPDTMSAFRPAITEAPNGDFLIIFNTSTDANPGGEVRLIRSTDRGRTWGPSEIIAAPSGRYEGGSIASSRGMTTLRDGTIVMTYGEAVNHTRFNNREGVKFVARSTDNGHTWEGTDEPIDFPVPFREQFDAGGRMIETADGTLLLPVWGTRELADDWETNPRRSESGVLRSFDGGRTWPEFEVIGYDPHDPVHSPPFYPYVFGASSTEFAVQQLPSGRIVAEIRYENVVDPVRWQLYRSYSDDDGATWSTPEPVGYVAPAYSFAFAPCTDELAGGQSKLVLGARGITQLGKAIMAVSFDEGVTWQDPFPLEHPDGNDFYGTLGGEPDFLRLDDRRVLVVFQASDDDRPYIPPGDPGKPWHIMANVLEDAAPDECRAQAAAAGERQASTPNVFVHRADRAEWTWALSAKNAVQPAGTTVGEFVATQAPALSCRADQPLRLRDEDGRALDPGDTLAEAGVRNGDSVELSTAQPMARPFRIGAAELDVSPATRHLANWDDACAPTPIALDYRSRGLGLDVAVPAGEVLSAVQLRDSAGNTRLKQSDYRLWTSPDNVHFTEVTGWSFASGVDDGRIVHRFGDLAVADRYLKVTHPYTDAAYTFVLDDPREDISLEFAARACDSVVTGPVTGPLTIDGDGTTCVTGATIAGPVTVEAGASVSVRDSRITGPLTSSGATAISVCDSTLTGRVAVSGSTGPVLIGEADGHDCGPNTITGPLSLDANTSTIRVAGNRIAGAVTLTANTFASSAYLGGNRIIGQLRCSGNAPEIDGGGNDVTGRVSGQCARL